MKNILFFSILLLSSQLYGQSITLTSNLYSDPVKIERTADLLQVNHAFMPELKGTKLISVRTPNPYFHRTYLIDKNGDTVSSGFMPSVYFRPNDNKVVITGRPMEQNDSFNPYGAKDFSSMLIYTTVNSFLSKIKLNKR